MDIFPKEEYNVKKGKKKKKGGGSPTSLALFRREVQPREGSPAMATIPKQRKSPQARPAKMKLKAKPQLA